MSATATSSTEISSAATPAPAPNPSKADRIIFVDDQDIMQTAVTQALSLEGFDVECFSAAEKALPKITENWRGVIISDIKMPGMDGLQMMQQIREIDEEIPVILISGHADIQTAVNAIRDGAYDFVEKPFRASQLCDVARRALDKRKLILDNRYLRGKLLLQRRQQMLLGNSDVMLELNKTLEYLAQTDADVLVTGETGTGKELVARSLHELGQRRNGEFVPINCGAMPESLFESEIFGHIKGAFTSADKNQTGKLEFANHGTFFLDEIESMPINLQIKMLRVLQERKLQKLGSNTEIDLDIRVVAATKANLLEASQRGKFREDLFYRLNVINLQIPPLRERKEDIPLLFRHFYDIASQRLGRAEQELPSSAIDAAMKHDWPGNVRELQNYAERVAIGLHDGGSVLSALDENPQTASVGATPGSNPQFVPETDTSSESLQVQMESVEREIIRKELQKQSGNITHTYKSLGVSRKTLYDKMKKHGLSKDRNSP